MGAIILNQAESIDEEEFQDWINKRALPAYQRVYAGRVKMGLDHIIFSVSFPITNYTMAMILKELTFGWKENKNTAISKEEVIR